MSNFSEDLIFAFKCTIKLIIASIILSLIDSKISFSIPLLFCFVSYFVFGALLLLFTENNPKWYLIKMTWNKSDLFEHVNTSMLDLCIILPTFIWIVYNYKLFSLILVDETEINNFYYSFEKWLMIPLGVLIGLIWRMFVHRIFHHPLFYKRIHKKHHDKPEKMTPFCAFHDHPIEFILMEVIGTFFIPCLLNPLPLPIISLLWSWQCFSGILDHSNAVVPGSYLIDAKYHYIHHQVSF